MRKSFFRFLHFFSGFFRSSRSFNASNSSKSFSSSQPSRSSKPSRSPDASSSSSVSRVPDSSFRISLYLKNFFLKDLFYKALSLLIAILLWITFWRGQSGISTYVFHLRFLLPSQGILRELSTDKVEVRFYGLHKYLPQIQDSLENRTHLDMDLRDNKWGRFSRKIDLSLEELPPTVKIKSISPYFVTGKMLKLKKEEEKNGTPEKEENEGDRKGGKGRDFHR